MKVSRKIIALAGLSGSGKTTLIVRLQSTLEFAHFSASELLKRYARRSGADVSSEQLRLGNIDANQITLIEAFHEAAAATPDNIIFDCHTIIDGASGIQEIPSEVFDAIGITSMAFLSVLPHTLAQRRESDVGRSRPGRSADELKAYQSVALHAATRIAKDCGVPFVDIGSNPERLLADLLCIYRSRDE